jgi:hypothetical protein
LVVNNTGDGAHKNEEGVLTAQTEIAMAQLLFPVEEDSTASHEGSNYCARFTLFHSVSVFEIQYTPHGSLFRSLAVEFFLIFTLPTDCLPLWKPTLMSGLFLRKEGARLMICFTR